MISTLLFQQPSKVFAAAVVLIFALLGHESNAQNIEKMKFPLSIKYVWQTTNIDVCWENPSPANQTERNWVRQAVQRTWETASAVRFVGWGRCASSSPGIRILIADDGPHVKELGRQIDGVEDGMVLNFMFNKWSRSCQNTRRFCIDNIAIHEFGHALGFAHEQNRPDAPTWCARERQGTDGAMVMSPFDLDSIMNYCNPRWNNHGRLSRWDIEGVRWLYGEPNPPIRWSYRGSIPGMVCTEFQEPADDHNWRDNYLCVNNVAPPIEWQWSHAGPISGMRCTHINEPGDRDGWNDNYLCVPNNSPIHFRWSYRGPISGMRCINVNEPWDKRGGWGDNYLCVPPTTANDFTWSYTGALNSGECIRFNEPWDENKGWEDNYLCTTGTPEFELHWSHAGRLAGMRCTHISEPGDSDGWNDNYLCVPQQSPLEFQWSYQGALPGASCWLINEPGDAGDGWNDNYLCARSTVRPTP